MRDETMVAISQLQRGNEMVIIFTGATNLLPLYVKNLSLASRVARDDFPDEKFKIMKTREYIKNLDNRNAGNPEERRII